MSAANLVMQSYGRCCASPDFFDSFYRHFLASSPLIREKFVDTDMSAQKQLLRQGILNLVMHARGMPDTKLRTRASIWTFAPNSTTCGSTRCWRPSANTTRSATQKCARPGVKC